MAGPKVRILRGIRVISWNLYHGRAVPPAGRSLLNEFYAQVASWNADIYMLQEVPPWWPQQFAEQLGYSWHMRLTSRNELLPLRAAIARRKPDLIKSNGGGCNAILSRYPILKSRELQLSLRPERRWLHAVELADYGWVVNTHLNGKPKEQTRVEHMRAVTIALEWAGVEQLIYGGDLNLKQPLDHGLNRAIGFHVDYIYTRGWKTVSTDVIDTAPLSDHRAIAATLALD